MKLVAISKERYRATAAQKRLYGGSTITRFWVYRPEDSDDPSKWVVVEGYGPSPGQRKTDAKARAIPLLREKGVLVENPKDNQMDWSRYIPNPGKLKPGERRVKTESGREVVERDLHFAGYDFTASPVGTKVHRRPIHSEGDYGADPLGPDETGEFTWRMVPSGDVVYLDERNRRLKK